MSAFGHNEAAPLRLPLGDVLFYLIKCSQVNCTTGKLCCRVCHFIIGSKRVTGCHRTPGRISCGTVCYKIAPHYVYS